MMKSLKTIRTIRISLLVTLLLSVSTACNDWIDIEPEDDLIKQEFWKTQDDLLAVVAAAYDAVRDNSFRALTDGEIRADMITLPTGETGLNAIAGNKILSTNYYSQWADYYDAINLANYVMFYGPIVQAEDKTLTDEILEEINAEMIFLRSLSYFYLARVWKDVPLVLEATVADTIDFFIPKSTEHEILQRLITDLEYASTIASTDFSPEYRANKYAILALLADIYLWNEDYDNCIATCDAIINSGRFSLEANSNWFSLYYPGNSPNESIFEAQFEQVIQGQASNMTEIDNYYIPVSQYDYDSQSDVRYCGGKGPSWKYIGTDETGRGSFRRIDGEFSANYIYYRYAEVLMMKAEALGEKGNFEEANALVSQVAERAGVIISPAYTTNSFRGLILTERNKEFGGEGKRWFDLLRFAKRNSFQNQELLINILLSKAENAQDRAIMRANVLDTMSYYLPIYEEELRLNRNLVQNPFYDR